MPRMFLFAKHAAEGKMATGARQQATVKRERVQQFNRSTSDLSEDGSIFRKHLQSGTPRSP
jgi:hypothetical protein